MEIYPAIDILGGRAVRLRQGDFSLAEAYYDDPLEAALAFEEAGARWLHVVDLDAARTGRSANRPVIRRLAQGCGLALQVGGGVRSQAAIDQLLTDGVNRVILGTAAVESVDWTGQMLARYGAGLAVGIDARDGKAATHGWARSSGHSAPELCYRLADAGARHIIYTDIARDGMLQGPNLAAYGTLAASLPPGVLIASGGVSSARDLVALRAAGCAGAIVGKALYQGTIHLKEVLALC